MLDDSAREFASAWHAGQTWGAYPYLEHLDRVAQVLKSLGCAPWQVAAAYLHDILEDTNCPQSLIEEKFGQNVLAWAWACTGHGNSRAAQQCDIVRKLQADDTGASLLKLADRLVNVRKSVEDRNLKLVEMYKKEQPLYDELFKNASPALHAELLELFARA